MKDLFLRQALICCLIFGGVCVASDLDPTLVRAVTEKWEETIQAMESRDETEEHPADSILFIGSSSIRLWETIDEDMAPYTSIQRGFGGSRFSDVAVYAERLIQPHSYQALVLFVGNDVSGKETDATPDQVAGWFQRVVAVSRAHNSEAPVFCIGVTPTMSRWEAWPRIQEVNAALQAACAADAGLHFIPTASAYLNGEGEPRPELFREDQLHQTRRGYQIWAAIIKSHLDGVLGGASN